MNIASLLPSGSLLDNPLDWTLTVFYLMALFTIMWVCFSFLLSLIWRRKQSARSAGQYLDLDFVRLQSSPHQEDAGRFNIRHTARSANAAKSRQKSDGASSDYDGSFSCDSGSSSGCDGGGGGH